MPRNDWKIIDLLADSLRSCDASTFDETVDRYVTAVIEKAIDIIPEGVGEPLWDGAAKAKAVQDMLFRLYGIQGGNPSYVAGRLGAVVDILALTAQRCVRDGFVEIVEDQKHSRLLSVLYRKRLSNSELAHEVGESEESVCRKLKELRDVGAVISGRQGRKATNSLAPAARAYIGDNERLIAQGAPFNMATSKPAPSVTVPKSERLEVPRLDASSPRAVAA